MDISIFYNAFQYVTNEMAKWIIEAPDFMHIEDDFRMVFDNFYKHLNTELIKHHFDITACTRKELQQLRFSLWTSDADLDKEIEDLRRDNNLTDAYKQVKIAKLENTRDLMLIPSWFAPLMPEDAEVISINGTKHLWKPDKMEMGSRVGMLAYGIKCPEIKDTVCCNLNWSVDIDVSDLDASHVDILGFAKDEALRVLRDDIDDLSSDDINIL